MIEHLRILVADDDSSMTEVLAAFLENRGYAVDSAENGFEALDRLAQCEYDLVISDINMAGMNGFELLKASRRRYPDIGIVLMTAYEEKYPLSEALRAGADGYISKPFDLRKFSLVFERAYWGALSRQDWWDEHAVNEG